MTVTATPGLVQDLPAVSQPVNVIESGAIFERAKTVVAQAVLEEPGVNLLRTSPTMAGIYVRGLTGNKVNVFVDGVRYSNSAQRGGVNTFLDLIEPTNLQAIEVLRGPNSAQYGSDALGGSVQFLSQVPSLARRARPRLARQPRHARHVAPTVSARDEPRRGVSAAQVRHAASTSPRGTSTKLRPARGSTRTRRSPGSSALPSDRLMHATLPDTGFTQYGGLLQASTGRRRANHQVVFSYTAPSRTTASATTSCWAATATWSPTCAT